MDSVQLKFNVRGSSGTDYEITASRSGINFRMTCTCEAGLHGTYCKHRFALLDGDISFLTSKNDADVIRLRELVTGTDVEKRYNLVCELERQKEQLDAKLKQEKKALAREMTD